MVATLRTEPMRSDLAGREWGDCVGANARGKSAGGMIWLEAIDAAEMLKKRLWPMFCAGFPDSIGDALVVRLKYGRGRAGPQKPHSDENPSD
jgi:hypothetical protein